MSFHGSLSKSGQRAAAPVPQAATDTVAGIHAVGPSVIARRGSVVCIAQGEPRFSDAPLAACARDAGIAAAWIRAFAMHGSEAPRLAGGRFAVVLVDLQAARVQMATDRFGTWPICWAATDVTLHFSDRADTVALPGRQIAPQALFDYLYYHCIPAPRTVFEGVYRLPAGHMAVWDAGRMQVQAWWQPHFDEQAQPDLAAAKARFMDIVRRSVEREAGPGTGAFLSGGTDSSTVAGLLCQAIGGPADTYSIGFDAAGYDEMDYARTAARHFGTRHHEYYVTAGDLLEGIPLVAAHYDQPFGNSSAVPAWICARRAREDGRARLLAGDGGDELFGGNTRYAKQSVFGIYDRVPRWLRQGLMEPALMNGLSRRLPGLKKGASYVEQARVPLPDRLQMYNLLWRLGPDEVLEPSFLDRVDLGAPGREQRDVWSQVHADSALNRMLAFDWKYTLADNDLPKVVGTTQLAGIDVAFPLLADELADFSLGIPTDWKLRGQQLRWFFKEALRGFLPEAIITKKKHGFGLPFGVWACTHGPLKALASEALGAMASRGVVRPAFVRALLDRLLPAHPGYYGEMVWILMMLEFWLRRHAPDYRLDPQSPVVSLPPESGA
jgi:asparagine synthase (glutamine-hydrolysing)